MSAPYWQDEQVTLLLGDALEVLRELPDASVACCVTSPPYYGLRDYGRDGQIGLEDSPAAYVERLCEVFAEVRRVLADDGTFWLNIGDSYYSGRGNPGPNSGDEKQVARRGWVRPVDRCGQEWGTRKSLLGIPWRLAFALQDDGWIIRNDIAWHKPNSMPESVTDRLAARWEHLFLLAKSSRYHFDLDAIREPHSPVSLARANRNRFAEDRSQEGVGSPNTINPKQACHDAGANPGDVWAAGMDIPPGKRRPKNGGKGLHHDSANESGRNPGDIWSIGTRPYPEAHFATFPLELPVRCIKAGARPGATVLDPFSGSGTTGEACRRLGRKYVGIDLNPAYHDLAIKRYAQGVIDFGEATA